MFGSGSMTQEDVAVVRVLVQALLRVNHPTDGAKMATKLRVLNLPMRFQGTLFGYVVRHKMTPFAAFR